VLIVDIDHFRRVNQRFGTQSGDLVLKELGALLQRSLRATDLVARLGGEEFIVLLPQTTLDAAQPVAEKIRKSVALSPVMDGIRPINITVSLGLAATQPGGLDNLYKAADLALHEAKRMGRNRVHVG
jgi:diguanylate cyclase (GGDEF)-like protein